MFASFTAERASSAKAMDGQWRDSFRSDSSRGAALSRALRIPSRGPTCGLRHAVGPLRRTEGGEGGIRTLETVLPI